MAVGLAVLAQRIFDNPNDESLVDEVLVGAIVAHYLNGLEKGLGSREVERYSNNIAQFATFKNFHNVKDLKRMAKKMSFEQYQIEALKLNKEYNLNWLRTEYNLMVRSGETIKDWKKFYAQESEYPLLKFQTAEDDKVRASHAVLNGIVKPVSDPFWASHSPPLEYNCRCKLIAVKKGNVTDTTETPDIVDPLFRNNPYKTGKVINEEHPYFDKVTKEQKAMLLNIADRIGKV